MAKRSMFVGMDVHKESIDISRPPTFLQICSLETSRTLRNFARRPLHFT